MALTTLTNGTLADADEVMDNFALCVRDLAKGLTPTQSGWNTAPTNLSNVTDGDLTTITGYGVRTGTGAGQTYGYVTIDLGAIYSIINVYLKLGDYYSTNNDTHNSVEYSVNGSDWYNLITEWQINSLTETIREKSYNGGLSARYIRVTTRAYDGSANSRIYELRVIGI